MRFLIDMPLPPSLAAELKRQGHDAVHASIIGMHAASDTSLLVFAARERRTVVTADLDFTRLLARAADIEVSLILFRGGLYTSSECVNRMERALAAVAGREDEQSSRSLETTQHGFASASREAR